MLGPGASKVAVVIVTRDRRDQLLHSLGRITALTEGGPTGCGPVVVVDNGSDDQTVPSVRHRFPRVKVISLPANFGAAGRNVGARQVDSDFIAFADDDSWWEPGALDRAAAIFDADDEVGLVAARVLVGDEATVDPVSEGMARGDLDEHLEVNPSGRRAVTGCLACAAVVRRSAFLSVGGFEPTIGMGGEEQMLVWDLWSSGWKAVYAPGVVVRHCPVPSEERSSRRGRVARNDVWAAWARLPVGAAIARTVAVVLRDGAGARGALAAARRFDWPLARRATVRGDLARAITALGG